MSDDQGAGDPAEVEALCWVEWAEGIDMRRRTVRVLQPGGRIVMQGTSLVPAPRVEGEQVVVALVPDPNAPDLDERARDVARRAIAQLVRLVGTGRTGPRELAFPFEATLQVRL